jgi:hypothetical protein
MVFIVFPEAGTLIAISQAKPKLGAGMAKEKPQETEAALPPENAKPKGKFKKNPDPGLGRAFVCWGGAWSQYRQRFQR